MTRETDSLPRITHIALKVSDIGRAAAFYRDVFGFRQTDLRRDGDHISCHLTDGTMDLALVEFDPGSVIGDASGEDTGIHHFGIDVNDTAKFAQAIKDALSTDEFKALAALRDEAFSRVDQMICSAL